MKVSPWNQYQFMVMAEEEGSDSDKLHLLDNLPKGRFFREFLSLIVCIASRRKNEGSSSSQHCDPRTSPVFSAADAAESGGEEGNTNNVRLKSSLKSRSASVRGCGVLGVIGDEGKRMKKVQWKDLCGAEDLAEIREFEFSDGEDAEGEIALTDVRSRGCIIQ